MKYERHMCLLIFFGDSGIIDEIQRKREERRRAGEEERRGGEEEGRGGLITQVEASAPQHTAMAEAQLQRSCGTGALEEEQWQGRCGREAMAG